MTLGAFWQTAVRASFEVAVATSLNRIPQAQQRAVFDQFGPESGQALFELFSWMLDTGRATAVDTDAVRCPVLCVRGTDDRVVSHGTARATAAAYPDAAFWEPSGHGHMLLVEPGAAKLARCIARWAGSPRANAGAAPACHRPRAGIGIHGLLQRAEAPRGKCDRTAGRPRVNVRRAVSHTRR